MGQSEPLNRDQKCQPDTRHGWVSGISSVQACCAGAPGERSALTEPALSMLKMVITLDGWLLLVLAGALGRERSEPCCRWPNVLQGKGGIWKRCPHALCVPDVRALTASVLLGVG